jgi:hypothetical protein
MKRTGDGQPSGHANRFETLDTWRCAALRGWRTRVTSHALDVRSTEGLMRFFRARLEGAAIEGDPRHNPLAKIHVVSTLCPSTLAAYPRRHARHLGRCRILPLQSSAIRPAHDRPEWTPEQKKKQQHLLRCARPFSCSVRACSYPVGATCAPMLDSGLIAHRNKASDRKAMRTASVLLIAASPCPAAASSPVTNRSDDGGRRAQSVRGRFVSSAQANPFHSRSTGLSNSNSRAARVAFESDPSTRPASDDRSYIVHSSYSASRRAEVSRTGRVGHRASHRRYGSSSFTSTLCSSTSLGGVFSIRASMPFASIRPAPIRSDPLHLVCCAPLLSRSTNQSDFSTRV